MRFVLASLCSLSAFAASSARLLDTLPVRFEQRASPAQWSAHGLGYSLSFSGPATVFRSGDRAVQLTFPGSNPQAQLRGVDAAAPTHYFVGSAQRSIPSFHRLRGLRIYPGIDVVYYGHGRQLEYDFEVAPGADPSRIRMRFDGADSLSLNSNGELTIMLGGAQVIQHVPAVYQRVRAHEIAAIQASYQMDDDHTVRLSLGNYNPAAALVVDPSITFAAYLEGSNGADAAISVGHDSQGKVYVAGYTYSTDFLQVGNASQTANAGDRDVWVLRLDLSAPPGESVLYAGYLGGSGRDDLKAMTVDAKGVMYMTGATASTNFPTTSGAYKTSNASDTHAFVSVLDPSQEGSAGLIYSSYFGGTGKRDEADAIALSGGKVYIAGFTNSPDLPVVAPIQTNYVNNYDAFVAAFDPTQGGSASLVLSTYFGGSLLDAAHAVAVDSAGRVYIAGVTYSTDFQVTPGSAYQAAYAGEGDAFLTVMDFTAGTLVYSTYFGGTSPDDIKKILIDPSGRVAMTGYTGSSDFPITQNAYQARFGGNGNAILTILDITKAGQGLVYSSYFGGSGGEVAYDLTRDGAGRYYLGGYTVSSDLPVAGSPLNGATAGAGVDGFLAVIDPAAPPLGSNALVYSTYITGQGFQVVYGLDVDASSVYVAGFTTADIFPSGAAQNSHPGKYDGFLLVLTLP